MPDPVTFDPEAVARLRRAIGRLARVLNASAMSEDLTPSQASVLAIIGFRGPIGPTEVARIEGINPTMLSRIVTKLDSAGLIRRTRTRPTSAPPCSRPPTPGGRGHSASGRSGRRPSRRSSPTSPTTTATLLAALPALEDLADGFDRTAADR
ncbi:MarR family winged helix-turn-helix transcriptional regulator [Pseudonocardia benzenivorans]